MDGYGSYGGGGGGGGDGRMEIVSGKGLGACHRPYSPTQHHHPPPPPVPGREGWSGGGGGGGGGGGAGRAGRAGKPWGFTDPEMKRKKRIARYKAYTVEGRMKASLRRGFQWIKNKCSEIVHGY